MSRKPKSNRSRCPEDDGVQKSDYRSAVFADKQVDKERPAELFRMDLISAMKLSDNEYVDRDDYFEITDQWREEWQKPVQVPVNLNDIPVSKVEPVHLSLALHSQSFSLPREKLLHFKADERFDTIVHQLTQHLVNEDANTCKYDADEQDAAWLRLFNVKLADCGLPPLKTDLFERFIEAWEIECHQNIAKRTGAGHTSEDEDTVCDVCWSPEGEEDNEMVFCDRCDICVHQACYGVAKIPETAWLCRPCSLGLQPTCCLCNKKSGALKPTKSGTRWAHVSCALWVPEVGFGDPDKMEPIINISKIPESRWSLVCSLCKQSNGAAIQCAVGACKTAFHVTCAFESSLEMQELLINDGADVTLKAYCRKHTAKLRGKQPNRGNQIGTEKGRSTQASREAARSAAASGLVGKASRGDEAEANFFELTSGAQNISDRLHVPAAIGEWVFAYWKMKRRTMFNKPLLSAVRACVVDKDRMPFSVDNPVLAALRRFIILRQDLERARNLCYLLVRREKQKRSLLRTQVDIYDKLPDQDNSSWRRLFVDGDSMPVIGASPNVSDLRLVFGLESVYTSSTSLEKESKILTADDRKLLETTAKKFCDAMAPVTSPPSSAPKVHRVSSPIKAEVSKAKAINPKLNKIRLRLAKSPSARTAAAKPAGPSPVKVPSTRPKVEKLKIKLPKASSSQASIFERIKDEFEFEPDTPPPPPKKRKQVKAKEVPGRSTKTTKAAGGKSAQSIAASAPVKHRRIKVPTYLADEESDSTSNSSNSTSDEESSSDSSIAEVNPRQLRGRRLAAPPSESESTSADDSESSSDESTSSGESTSGDSSSEASSTSDSDFVKTPPKKVRRR